MYFRELSYVLAIAEHQNISKAAESLYVGQPSLSKFLMNLENELGIKLFRRLGHKYVLTYAGECYVEKAKAILHLKDDLETQLSDIIKNDSGVLDAAFASMRCTSMLPAVLPVFDREYPNVKVNIFEGSSDENDKLLLDGKVEVAFYTRPSAENPLINYESLGGEELLICAKKDHPFNQLAVKNPSSSYPMIDLKLLEKERVILMYPEQRTRQIVDTCLHESGVILHDTLCTRNIPAIIDLSSIGYGVAFIFSSHLKYHSAELSLFSFTNPPFTTDFVAATRKGAYIHNYTKAFIDIVQEAFAEEK